LTDADPHREGLPVPKWDRKSQIRQSEKSGLSSSLTFIKRAAGHCQTKAREWFLLPGIAHQPAIPGFQERYKLRPGCIAVYPMYKGLAQLVGMTKLRRSANHREQFERYRTNTKLRLFLHSLQNTDMYGEDGNFAAKKKPTRISTPPCRYSAKAPDVLAITGDHSTPCVLKRAFGGHPQPCCCIRNAPGLMKLQALHRNRG